MSEIEYDCDDPFESFERLRIENDLLRSQLDYQATTITNLNIRLLELLADETERLDGAKR